MKTVFCRMMNHARFTAMNVSSINPHQSHFSFLQEQEIADIMNEVLLLSSHCSVEPASQPCFMMLLVWAMENGENSLRKLGAERIKMGIHDALSNVVKP